MSQIIHTVPQKTSEKHQVSIKMGADNGADLAFFFSNLEEVD